MKSVSLLFGTHNTLPVGDFEFVFERVYQRAYKPFLSVLNRFPDVPVVLHYSGVLLEWFEKNHPEVLMLLGEMVKRKQVELLTGGYYEPVLPVIPNPDKLGQIEKLTTFLRGHFGKRSRGGWLADRIWEPSLASTLNTGGVEYTFVTDGHLRAAGIDASELNYSYLTEDQGKPLVIYPLSESFSEMLGTEEPEKVVEALKRQADTSGKKVVTIIEDGERFGDWEGTYKVFYEERWLERFFTLLSESREVVRTVVPGQGLRDLLPKAKAYFPATTYEQVMAWVPPGEEEAASRRRRGGYNGGNFRQFLTRYPESNLLYSRMQYTHLLVNQIRGDKTRKRSAREELWKGQCSIPYRHGRCGGIYTSRLRKRAYQSFIEAEKITRDNGTMLTPSIHSLDFDLDGHKEFLHHGPNINAFVHPCGGTIFELDFLPASWNYGDTLSRRPEDYHRPQDRSYDAYPRRIFVDHFLDAATTIEDFSSGSHKELGDFALGEFSLEDLDRDKRELSLTRTGLVDGSPVLVNKRYRFKKSTIYLGYRIQNGGSERKTLRFGAEMNLAFDAGIAKALRIQAEDKAKSGIIDLNPTVLSDVSSLDLRDMVNQVLLRLRTDRDFSLWCFPLETTFRTAQSWEAEYQATCIVPQWEIELEPDEEWQVEIALNITRL